MKTGFIETDRDGDNVSVPFLAPDNRTVQEIVDTATGLSIPDSVMDDPPKLGVYLLVFEGDGLADDGYATHVRVWQSTE